MDGCMDGVTTEMEMEVCMCVLSAETRLSHDLQHGIFGPTLSIGICPIQLYR
jgi:hypothetical protein